MADIKLIHASRVYADKILEAVMGEQSIDENKVRQIMFDCFTDAWNKAFEAAMKLPSPREDMGR